MKTATKSDFVAAQVKRDGLRRTLTCALWRSGRGRGRLRCTVQAALKDTRVTQPEKGYFSFTFTGDGCGGQCPTSGCYQEDLNCEYCLAAWYGRRCEHRCRGCVDGGVVVCGAQEVVPAGLVVQVQPDREAWVQRHEGRLPRVRGHGGPLALHVQRELHRQHRGQGRLRCRAGTVRRLATLSRLRFAAIGRGRGRLRCTVCRLR